MALSCGLRFRIRPPAVVVEESDNNAISPAAQAAMDQVHACLRSPATPLTSYAWLQTLTSSLCEV